MEMESRIFQFRTASLGRGGEDNDLDMFEGAR